jgi:Xaa-Pro aminopeptidase
VGRRSAFIFIDTGISIDTGRAEGGDADGGNVKEQLRRVAVTGFADARLRRFFESPDEPRPLREVLPELIEEHDPATIALSIGGRRGPTTSLTKDSHDQLMEILGEQGAARVVSAAGLIEEYVNTRLLAELAHYRVAVELTEEIGRRAFSNEVIQPGRTTVGEVRAWILDQMWAHRVEPWFTPDIRVQRHGRVGSTSRGFLATTTEDVVIQRGDLLHLDIGFEYLGLATDWQKMAYVLREGEAGVPPGLSRALAETNRLQDALCSRSRPGMSAGEVYSATMAEMKELGIQAQIYSHPLNRFGHGLGATIDFRSAEKKDAEERLAKTLRLGSYMAIELNTSTELIEWDNQRIWIMEEDPAYLTEQGWVFFVPRQRSLYLIR